MLIVKVFINQKQIDEIHIHNEGDGRSEDEKVYGIHTPKKYSGISIFHKPKEGYKKLLMRALDFMDWKDKSGEKENQYER